MFLAQHIASIDGKRGLFTGLAPRLCSGVLGTVVHGKVLQVRRKSVYLPIDLDFSFRQFKSSFKDICITMAFLLLEKHLHEIPILNSFLGSKGNLYKMKELILIYTAFFL